MPELPSVSPFDNSTLATAISVAALAALIHYTPLSSNDYKLQKTIKSLSAALSQPSDDGKDLVQPATYRQISLNPLEWLRLYAPPLTLNAPALFRQVREVWGIDEELYKACFEAPAIRQGPNGKGGGGEFLFAGPPASHKDPERRRKEGKMDDTHWILKSLTREFETKFFFSTFLPAYIPYAKSHPSSLLVRCSDTLYNFEVYLGHLGGLSSGNYMVMEDLISRARALSEDSEDVDDWDLKPGGYMHPEKDTIGLGSDEEKEDEEEGIKDGTVWLREDDWEWVRTTFERDTQFLADLGIVDYSLLLTRSPLPASYSPEEESQDERNRPVLISPDNKYIYHLAIIDYMISKHTWFPQLMENIAHPLNKKIQDWGRCEGKKWRYTMTEEPGTYRKEFLKMVSKAVRTDAKAEE
ncbi:hypothetical protein YB2330_001515 [Saitoella coloradoensis]